jgi:hypothetical protein
MLVWETGGPRGTMSGVGGFRLNPVSRAMFECGLLKSIIFQAGNGCCYMCPFSM